MSEFVSKHKKFLIIIFAVAIAVLIIPMVSAGAYTYLCEDDFSFEGGARDLIRDYGNIYVGAAHRMVEYYNSNEGSFLFDFIMSAFIMYTRGGLPLLHVFMVLNIALFFFTLGMLIKQVVRDWTATLGVCLSAALMLVSMDHTITGVEIYFWYTGVMYMLLVFTLSFITSILSIQNIRTGKLRYAIAGMIIGFFASGGSLNVTSANCSWLLAILILSFPKVKEKKSVALPFIGSFIGALINAVAPGNFNRLDGGPLNVWTGLSDTFMCYISDVKLLFVSRVFWFAMILSFAIVALLKIKILPKGVSNVQLIIAIVGSWLVKYFGLFPISFATRMNDINLFSWRTFSSYEVIAKIMFIFQAIILAQWATERKEKIAQYAGVGLMAACVLFMLITYPATKADLKSGIAYTVIDDFRTGAMVENYNMREYILSSLANAPEGSDAIINVPPFRKANSCCGMGLGIDCEEFVNRSAAGVFRLHTVTIIYAE